MNSIYQEELDLALRQLAAPLALLLALGGAALTWPTPPQRPIVLHSAPQPVVQPAP